MKNPYLNPFNPVVTVSFDIPKTSMVDISVYDILGRKISTLNNTTYFPGKHNLDWNASNYSSGVYFIQFKSLDYTKTKKITLIK